LEAPICSPLRSPKAGEIGAVLGREFSYGLLSAVAAAPVAAVADRGDGVIKAAQQSALDRLPEADLLFVEGLGARATYRFKHALIQDAAYESLLKSRRQALHCRAAEALLAAPDPQPELVAHHFTQAGATEPAIEWWGKAGDAALRRSAFQEAIAHLGKAIEMADKAGAEEKEKAGDTLKLQVAYGNALMAAVRAPLKPRRFSGRVQTLAAGDDEIVKRSLAYFGLWVATAVAKQQAARSFGRRAALALAKLYQTTGRPADAHAVLTPALEGFSPTSEMPEIGEAQALMEPLA
jgi:predicted ATPase